MIQRESEGFGFPQHLAGSRLQGLYWALEYHTLVLFFLKANHYEIKVYTVFSLVT